MSRRRPQKPVRASRPEPFHAPFGELARAIGRTLPASATVSRATERRRQAAVATTGAAPKRRRDGAAATDSARADGDGLDLFAQAMADVARLEADPRVDAPRPARGAVRLPAVTDEGEALAALSDLVAGAAEFDLSDSTEYVEGAVVGLDARILRRLRRGEFAYQATLDLHGMSATPAHAAVEDLIRRSVLAGHRCVLIVHGRGRNSRDNVPVLKERLKSWLARGKIGRAVLAFTSARPADGGTGALYVLLRRRRGAKEPMAVYEGAKRE